MARPTAWLAPPPLRDAPGEAGQAVFGELFDASLDAIVLMTRSGVVTAWNQRAEEAFGWSAHDAIGRRISELIVPEPQREDHERGLRRVGHGGKSRLIGRRRRLTALHRDGHEVPVELTVSEVAGGLYAGFLRDLSRETEAESARHDAETRYRSLVERLPGIAYVSEVAGQSRFVSPQVERLFGFTAAEWSFELWRERLHRRDRRSVLAALEAGVASGQPFTLRYRFRARDGRWLRIRDEAAVVAERDGGRSIHGVMFDVTRERTAELELLASRRERRQVTASLRRLQARATVEETASAICSELSSMRYIDVAFIHVFEGDGSVVPLAIEAPPGAPVRVGHPVPPARAQYLRESATGPWVDEWAAAPADDEYGRRWLDVGLTAAAYVPFGAGGEVYGLLVAGTTARIGSEGVTRWLPALAEYAALSGALLVPALAGRRARADVAGPIRTAIEAGAFATHFQPIVELESRTVVGYEALTRFADGVPAEARFADADMVGLAQELEVACLRSALDVSRGLPAGKWLSINISPAVLGALEEQGVLDQQAGRPLVLELTERLEISDYSKVLRDLGRIRGRVSVAVDDAGAGFASLRHIVELRPRYVKLDRRLVRGVDADAARQALIAGMVYFSRQTDCILIAEGIETEPERRALRRLGVTFGQGFLFGYPQPAEALGEPPA